MTTPRSRFFMPNVFGVETAALAGNGPIAGFTQNMQLNLVNFNWVTWHDYEWENWVVVDTLLHNALYNVNIVGAWRPNTAYVTGQIVIDVTNGALLVADNDHTSSTSLPDDVTAGHWSSYDSTDNVVRTDVTTLQTINSQFALQSTTPQIRFRETDAVSPDGQYAFSGYGTGNLKLERFTGPDFTAPIDIWRCLHDATTTFIFDVPVSCAHPVRFSDIFLGATAAGVDTDNRLAAVAGVSLHIQSGVATSGMVTFRDSSDASVATIAPAGNASPSSFTIITREKGDLRYAASSSERYKDNITDAVDAELVDAFDALTLRTWIWGGEIPQADERFGTRGVGLIVEELLPTYPPAVRQRWVQPPSDEEGNQPPATVMIPDALDSNATIALLIAKIRSQDARIAALEGAQP